MAVLIAAFPRLSAQESPTVKVEIRSLAFEPSLRSDKAFIHDPASGGTSPAVPLAIKTYLNHQFATVLLKSRRLVITTTPDVASLTRDGEVIADATLPTQVNSAILLFLPARNGTKARCEVMVIDDSKRAFPAGSYHASNLSPTPVRLMLENKSFDFKSGQVLLIEDPPVREGNQSGMRAFAFKDQAWKQVSTGLWPHPGQARSLLVMHSNPRSSELEIRAFDDVPPRKSSTAATPAP